MTRAVKLHLASEFLPVLAFYVTCQWTDFTTSAGVLAGTTAIATAASVYYEKRVPIVSVSSSVFVIGAGLLSYGFNNPDILILADSLYYFAAAAVIAAGLCRRHYLLHDIFDGALTLSPARWRTLSWWWIGAATLAGIGNELVRLFATPELWIDYKLVKVVLILSFVLGSFLLVRAHTRSQLATTPPSTLH
jgi:intracellular septation protein A